MTCRTVENHKRKWHQARFPARARHLENMSHPADTTSAAATTTAATITTTAGTTTFYYLFGKAPMSRERGQPQLSLVAQP